MAKRPLRILTWSVHGNYMLYLSQCEHQFYLPVDPSRLGHGGRGTTFPFGDNVIDVPAEEVQNLDVDCVLYQHRQNYEEDRFLLLSPEQHRLPSIYLEHDPPQESVTEAQHWVDDPDVLLVHVTHFNRLMWDCGRTPTRVIEHGVFLMEPATYSGELARGVVIINNLPAGGRRLGLDIYRDVRMRVPLDLVGLGSEPIGGLGQVEPPRLPTFAAHYRFLFSPVRYTSLGLAVCEAMMVGIPIVGLATTELSRVIDNGISGFVDTDVEQLVRWMQLLSRDLGLAKKLGQQARRVATQRFDIRRFLLDWEAALAMVTGTGVQLSAAGR